MGYLCLLIFIMTFSFGTTMKNLDIRKTLYNAHHSLKYVATLTFIIRNNKSIGFLFLCQNFVMLMLTFLYYVSFLYVNLCLFHFLYVYYINLSFVGYSSCFVLIVYIRYNFSICHSPMVNYL